MEKGTMKILPLGPTPNHSQLAAQEGNGYERCPYHSKVHNRSGKYAKMKDMVNWRANGCLTNISVRKRDFIEKLNLREQIYKIDPIFSARDHRVI
jgi:hypothetical protein